MVESKPLQTENDKELTVIFWIMNNSKYDKLRLINGCEKQFDLEATPKDVEHIRKMAKAFGVKDENLFIDSEKTSYKELN